MKTGSMTAAGSLFLLSAIALTLIDGAQAAASPYPDANTDAGVVRMSMSRSTAEDAEQISQLPSLRKRRELLSRASNPFGASLSNNVTQGAYFINITIGTPGQPLSLIIDTGSSDLFVMDQQADQCTSARLQRVDGPCIGGTYDHSKSSSYKLLNQGGFNTSFGDGTQAIGDWISETIGFPASGTTVTGLQVGDALSTDSGAGIMGIGLDTDEAAISQYPNIIDQLLSEGLITAKAYSLYLDDLDDSTGEIIFGGVDSSKYTAPLVSLPMQPTISNTITDFAVALTSVSISSGSGSSNSTTLTSSNFVQPAILDSGTTATYLPDSAIEALFTALGNSLQQDREGDIAADCSLPSQQPDMTFDFQLGGSQGITIRIPISEMVIGANAVSTSGSSSNPFSQGISSLCDFGIQPLPAGNPIILGDSFLRSAYVVYDLSNLQIGLAQTKFNVTGDNSVQAVSTAAGIPGATSVPSGGPSAVVSVSSLLPIGVGGHTTRTLSTVTTGTATAGSGSGGTTGTAAGGAAASSSTSKAGAAAAGVFSDRGVGYLWGGIVLLWAFVIGGGLLVWL